MGFKKFLVGGNGFPTDFSIGGLPIFSDDLKQLETNAQIFGLYGMLKGWSCILSGCQIDEVDTNANTLTMLPGLVLLNDVVYVIPKLENQTYPFSITKGANVIDTRLFKDGNAKDVAIEYNHNIRTSFTYNDGIGGSQPNQNPNFPFPIDITDEEVFFDPFSTQKSEYIIANLNRGIFDRIFPHGAPLIVTKTETGKNIIGTGLDILFQGFFAKWKYYQFSNSSASQFVFRLGGLGDHSLGGNQTHNIQLTKEQLPTHTHSNGSLQTSEPLVDGFSTVERPVLSGASTLVNNITFDGSQNIDGDTGNGSSDGLNNDFINIENEYQRNPSMTWNGYDGDTFGLAIYAGVTYKFWKDGTYFGPNM